MKIREIEIDDAIAEQDKDKIEDAQGGGARAAPGSGAAQPQVAGIHCQNQHGDDLLGISVPIAAPDPIDPQESKTDTDEERYQPNDHTAAAHSFQRFK